MLNEGGVGYSLRHETHVYIEGNVEKDLQMGLTHPSAPSVFMSEYLQVY